MRYDYKSGSFIKTSSILSKFQKDKQDYVRRAGGDFYTDVRNAITKNDNKSDAQKRKEIKELDKFIIL